MTTFVGSNNPGFTASPVKGLTKAVLQESPQSLRDLGSGRFARDQSECRETFLAIQNASRVGFRELNYCLKKNTVFPKNYKDLFFIPNLICFGQDDVDGAKKENLNVGKFYNYGSVRISNFFCYSRENNIKLKKDLFDVCLVSEPMINHNNDYQNDTIEDSGMLKKVVC